jgi:lactoylglutathione lyase
MPRREHVALWTERLEVLCDFHERFSGGQAGAKYANSQTGFESYFISFDDGTRLEVMTAPDVRPGGGAFAGRGLGLTHLAFSVGSPEAVDALTDVLRAGGYTVAGEPRWTGDGYYESVVRDREGNCVDGMVEGRPSD